MSKRKITDLYNVEFKPFDNYGKVIPGMSWCKISYNRDDGGSGTYILKSVQREIGHLTGLLANPLCQMI